MLVDRVKAADVKNRTLVNGVYFLDPVESGDPTVEEILAEIETYLSAHFYTLRDPRASQEQAGSVGATYQSAVDLNLYTSHYGQMAMTLDVTNTLRNLSDGKRPTPPSVTWLGINRCLP